MAGRFAKEHNAGMAAMTTIERLGQMFYGFDLKRRKHGTDWPKPWRAAVMTSKNEISDYRVSAYGDTAEEACQLLLDRVAAIRRSHGF